MLLQHLALKKDCANELFYTFRLFLMCFVFSQFENDGLLFFFLLGLTQVHLFSQRLILVFLLLSSSSGSTFVTPFLATTTRNRTSLLLWLLLLTANILTQCGSDPSLREIMFQRKKTREKFFFAVKTTLLLFAFHGCLLLVAGSTCHCFVVLLSWEVHLLAQLCVIKFGLLTRRSFSIVSTCCFTA